MKKALLLLIFGVILTMQTACQQENFKLTAIKCGDSLFHSRNVFRKDSYNKLMEFSWLFYLIEYNDKLILVDTGFTQEYYARRFKLDKFTPTVELLNKLGISADDISDVIITHSHFDHIGGANAFSNATIYIQRDEWQNFKKRPSRLLQPIVDFLDNYPNLVLFDGEYLLYDKFRIVRIGGHTIGSSVVYFDHNQKKCVLTGDECYTTNNYLESKAVGALYNLQSNLNFINHIKGTNFVKYTFHDPSVINKDAYFKVLIEE